VLLRGFGTATAPAGVGLALTDNLGPVWVEDATLVGGAAPLDLEGPAGAAISGSEGASFHRCTLTGGSGGAIGGTTATGGNGGPALQAAVSTVFVQACTLAGGAGANPLTGLTASLGGPGLRTSSGVVVVTDCEVTGGPGGNTPVPLGGSGGHGVVSVGGLTRVVAAQSAGGQPAGGGLPGQPYVALAGTIELIGSAGPFDAFAQLTAASPVRENQQLGLSYDAPPNAQLVFLAYSLGQGPLYVSGATFSLYPSAPLSLIALGATDFDGDLATSLPIPSLPPAANAATAYLQAYSVVDFGGGALSIAVSNGSAVTLLDSSF